MIILILIGLSLYQTIPGFSRNKPLKKLWEKEKMLVLSSIFSFSDIAFYLIKDKSKHLSTIYIVKEFRAFYRVFVMETNDRSRTLDSAEQDQAAHMYRLILICTLHKMNLWSGMARYRLTLNQITKFYT